MSRLTSAQVISLGEYLEPDFDPSSLTVSQLLGVLGYHNVHFPTPYSKSKLTQLFNDEIKTRASKLRKERLKKANSIASDDGITDGVTGKPLTTRVKAEPIPRRSSRRLSHAPADEDEEIPPPPPDPPKRRRSSAQPALGGPSRRRAPVQPALTEESEPDEEESLPLKKVGRSKKASEAAGTQARRISNTIAEDSGWEDNNIFQSGAESSSPARPSPVRPKVSRKSGVPRKTRKSMSAPPQIADSSSPIRKQSSPFSPVQNTFNPVFPASHDRITPLKFTSPTAKPAVIREESSGDETNMASNAIKEEEYEESKEDELIDSDSHSLSHDDHNAAVSHRLAGGEANGTLALRPRPSGLVQYASRLFSLLCITAIVLTTLSYKVESAAIGFCETGSRTNNALEALRARRIAIESCNRENRTLLNLPSLRQTSQDSDTTPCPLPPLVPLPRPDSCTPCPNHATCTQFNVQCDNGYLLRPHPLLSFLPDPPSSSNLSFSPSMSPSELVWTSISTAVDGLPSFGSIGLPPRCLQDPKRQRNIGALGKAVESLLSQERGRRLCVGGEGLEAEIKDEGGGEAKKWGVEIDKLREIMKRKTAARFKATFDDTFNEAIQELIQWGSVILGADQEGHRYLASKDTDLSWDCVLTVKSRELWAAWRTTALGLTAAMVTALLARLRAIQKQSETRRVSELVQIALDTLRNQELAHHTDPVTAPHPYLSSIQLRDLILQNEHSIPTRRRLWDQVEHVVEGNANVRANLEEIEGGDELRVWRWVGNAGRGII